MLCVSLSEAILAAQDSDAVAVTISFPRVEAALVLHLEKGCLVRRHPRTASTVTYFPPDMPCGEGHGFDDVSAHVADQYFFSQSHALFISPVRKSSSASTSCFTFRRTRGHGHLHQFGDSIPIHDQIPQFLLARKRPVISVFSQSGRNILDQELAGLLFNRLYPLDPMVTHRFDPFHLLRAVLRAVGAVFRSRRSRRFSGFPPA